MDKKLDLEKVEQALKRAADAAIEGSKDIRAGRLVVRNSESGRLSKQASAKPNRGGKSPK